MSEKFQKRSIEKNIRHQDQDCKASHGDIQEKTKPNRQTEKKTEKEEKSDNGRPGEATVPEGRGEELSVLEGSEV